MRSSRFFYLYLIGGFISVGIIIYDVLTAYPAVKMYQLTLEIVLGLFFFYMANKTYHEKKDKELM